MKLRKLNNDDNRTIIESILVPELIQAFKDWPKQNCVLIGGLALSYYVKPRTTTDIDILYQSEQNIPSQANNFKRNKDHSFKHKLTGVEIETLTPNFINIPQDLIQQIFDTAIKTEDCLIASPAGLISLKLHRNSFQDRADIAALLQKYPNIDITNYNLNQELTNKFNKIKKELS